MRNFVDESKHTRIAICIERKLKSTNVVDVRASLLITRGVPEHVPSANGAEFIVQAAQAWIATVGQRSRTSRQAVRGARPREARRC